MNKKQSNFIEAHIEKIILAISAVIAMYIVYSFVVVPRDNVPIDGQLLGPGEVDTYIAEQSEKLKERLSRNADPRPAYKPQSIEFLAKLNSSLDSNFSVLWPVPSATEKSVDKKYRIPVVAEINNVEAEHIRAAAYLPKVDVTKDNAGSETTYEANDLDLITVQANFNIAELIDSFQDCFTGKGVPEGWRDAGLARPIFAGVQLQRQRLGWDGQWSQWEDVPRIKIDPKRNEYTIKDSVSDLPSGGVMVMLAKFSDPGVQSGLLQPDGYRIASADEQWLPPVLHKKYLTIKKEKEAQERREAAEERQTKAAEERDKVTSATRSAREERTAERSRTTESTSRTSSSGRGGSGGYRGPGGGGSRSGPPMSSASSRSPSRTPAVRQDRAADRSNRQPDSTIADQKKITKTTVTEATISDEMRKMQLGRKDLSALRETVTIWAYDDTVAPGESYRYRMRIGVFNPVAGTGQVRPEDAVRDSNVVLWSAFSDTTDIIDVPRRLYFFPINVQEAAKAVEVQVCKYVLGYWYSEQFMVKRGDVIGKPAKVEVSDKDKDSGVKLPDMIDYSTGSIMVDVVAMNDWFGDKALQARQYFDMLFSDDGTSIARLAAKQMFWPDELRAKYNELKALEKKTKEPLRAWTASGTEIVPRGVPGMPGDRRGMPPDRMQMEDYMRMRMGDRGGTP